MDLQKFLVHMGIALRTHFCMEGLGVMSESEKFNQELKETMKYFEAYDSKYTPNLHYVKRFAKRIAIGLGLCEKDVDALVLLPVEGYFRKALFPHIYVDIILGNHDAKHDTINVHDVLRFVVQRDIHKEEFMEYVTVYRWDMPWQNMNSNAAERKTWVWTAADADSKKLNLSALFEAKK